MRAQEVSFLSLIQGEKQFQVPLYQRTYSWQERQLQPLWRDVLDQAEGLSRGAGRSTHFLGSVVLAPSADLTAGGVQRWLVVDGQQRLTTLLLLLAAIRDHLGPGQERDADRIHRQYLVNEFRSGEEHLRLLPTQADRTAFRHLILRTRGPATADGVGEAYRFFRSALNATDDPDDDHDIARIESVVRDHLSIVEVTAERGDNVYRIFESLNNTGLRLTQADLLRNYLFMRLPSRGEDVYRDVWLPMQERLSSSQLELLVWLDLVIRGNDRVKQSDIYRAQQERLEPLASDEAALEREVMELARRARHLERVLHPSVEPNRQLREVFERLGEWGTQAAYPLVLHLLDLEERGICATQDVIESLLYVESFLVRRMLCQVPTNNLNRVLNAGPSVLQEETPVPGAVRRYLSARRRQWPSDAEVRRSARTRPFYWTGRGPQRYFVLRRLEESYQAPEPVDFAKAALTIEHVLPQTLTPEWLALLAGDVSEESGPEELHDLLVHTLGNLTLTAQNASLSNHPLERKQDIFKASALQMNREIALAPSWGKTQIYDRADRLAERIIKLWPGPIGSNDAPDAAGRDWSLLRRALAALPDGTWTTYGDVAELIGSHPVPVGVHLATQPVPNAWRVLLSDGSISGGFRWTDSSRTDAPQQVLEEEGVRFIGSRADHAQRVRAAELAELVGMGVPESRQPAPAAAEDAGRAAQFQGQLKQHHPATASAVERLLDHWRSLGGRPGYGRSSEVSCFLALDRSPAVPDVWPLTIYPVAGVIEVSFGTLRRRPPFDDVALREEFRGRLNEVPGVDVPGSKIGLYPSLGLDVLQEPNALSRLSAALEWFAVSAQTYVEAMNSAPAEPGIGVA